MADLHPVSSQLRLRQMFQQRVAEPNTDRKRHRSRLWSDRSATRGAEPLLRELARNEVAL